MAERKDCEKCGHYGVLRGKGLCGRCYRRQYLSGSPEARARNREYVRRYRAKKKLKEEKPSGPPED